MNRDLTIDVLRFIGISLIILAHILGPGSLLFQIRSFDVPLMVFVSGLANSGKTMQNYWAYLKRRLPRLVIPVWLFYTFYFLIEYIGYRAGIVSSFLETKQIVNTFLCIEGYGWIIRVFVLIMLVTPFISLLEEKVSDRVFAIISIALISLHAILFPFYHAFSRPGLVQQIMDLTIPYLLGYVPAYMIGIMMRKASVWSKLILGVSFLCVLGICCSLQITNNGGFDIETFKWPPQLPFICYGVGVSCLLWALKKPLVLLSKWNVVVFIGQNTIWIYLWHILALSFIFRITNIWWFQYLIVYGFALFLCWVQNRISAFLPSDIGKYLKG